MDNNNITAEKAKVACNKMWAVTAVYGIMVAGLCYIYGVSKKTAKHKEGSK